MSDYAVDMTIAAQSAETEAWLRNYLRVVDGKDMAGLDALVDDDCEFHDCRYPPIIGKAALTEWGAELFNGMADQKREAIVNMAVTGRIAMAEYHFSGRHVGPYLGFPATGNVVKWSAVAIYTFSDAGRLVRQMYYNDVAALEAQLGGPPLPAA